MVKIQVKAVVYRKTFRRSWLKFIAHITPDDNDVCVHVEVIMKHLPGLSCRNTPLSNEAYGYRPSDHRSTLSLYMIE